MNSKCDTAGNIEARYESGSGDRVLVANVMALQAGRRQLDFTAWDEHKDGYFAAIQAGMSSDYEPMKSLVRRVLRESGGKTGE